MNSLVLSIFPGIGLLEGFCVVRGPDVIWGGDIRGFNPPADKFDGVIGGPPCQTFSALAHLVRNNGHEPKFGNLIPEFERIVALTAPDWFLMENVPAAPFPSVYGYRRHSFTLSPMWIGEEQHRTRVFSFGVKGDAAIDLRKHIEWSALDSYFLAPAVVAGHGLPPSQRDKARSVTGDMRVVSNGARVRREKNYKGAPQGAYMPISEMCRLQGLPETFTDEMPFTSHGKRKAVGNGVPLPMGRAIARAIKSTLTRPDLNDV